MSLLPPHPLAQPAAKKRPSGLLSGGHLVAVSHQAEKCRSTDSLSPATAWTSPEEPTVPSACPQEAPNPSRDTQSGNVSDVRGASSIVQMRQTKKRKLESLVAKMKTEACNRVMEQSLRDIAEYTQSTDVCNKPERVQDADQNNTEAPPSKVPRRKSHTDVRAVSIDLPDGKCKVWLEGISKRDNDKPQGVTSPCAESSGNKSKILYSLLTNSTRCDQNIESKIKTKNNDISSKPYVSIMRQNSGGGSSGTPKTSGSVSPGQSLLKQKVHSPRTKMPGKCYMQSLLKPSPPVPTSSPSVVSVPTPVSGALSYMTASPVITKDSDMPHYRPRITSMNNTLPQHVERPTQTSLLKPEVKQDVRRRSSQGHRRNSGTNDFSKMSRDSPLLKRNVCDISDNIEKGASCVNFCDTGSKCLKGTFGNKTLSDSRLNSTVSSHIPDSPNVFIGGLSAQNCVLDLSQKGSDAVSGGISESIASDEPIDLTCKISVHSPTVIEPSSHEYKLSDKAVVDISSWLGVPDIDQKPFRMKPLGIKKSGHTSIDSRDSVIDLSKKCDSNIGSEIFPKSEKSWTASSVSDIQCNRQTLLSSGGGLIMTEGVAKTKSVLNSSAVLMQSLVTGHVFSDKSWKYNQPVVCTKSTENNDANIELSGVSDKTSVTSRAKRKRLSLKCPHSQDNMADSSDFISGLLSGKIPTPQLEVGPAIPGLEPPATKTETLDSVIGTPTTIKTIVPLSIEPDTAVAGGSLTTSPSHTAPPTSPFGHHHGTLQHLTQVRESACSLSPKRFAMDKALLKALDSNCDSDVEITGSKKRSRHNYNKDFVSEGFSESTHVYGTSDDLFDYKNDIVILGSHPDIGNAKIVKIEKLSRECDHTNKLTSDVIVNAHPVKSEESITETIFPALDNQALPHTPVKQEELSSQTVPPFPVIGSIQLLGNISVSKVSDEATEHKDDKEETQNDSDKPSILGPTEQSGAVRDGGSSDRNPQDNKKSSLTERGNTRPVIHCTKRKDMLNVITISGNSICPSPDNSNLNPFPECTSKSSTILASTESTSEQNSHPKVLERDANNEFPSLREDIKGGGINKPSDIDEDHSRKADDDKRNEKTACDTSKKSNLSSLTSQEGVSPTAQKKTSGEPNPNYVIEITPQPMWSDKSAASKNQVFRSLLTGKLVRPSPGSKSGKFEEPNKPGPQISTSHPTKTLMIIQQIPTVSKKHAIKPPNDCDQKAGKQTTKLKHVSDSTDVSDQLVGKYSECMENKEEHKELVGPEVESLAGALWRELMGSGPEVDDMSLPSMTPRSLLSWPEYDIDLNHPPQFVDWNNDIIDLDLYDPLDIQSDWKPDTMDTEFTDTNETVLNLKSDMTLGTVTIRSNQYNSQHGKMDSVTCVASDLPYSSPRRCKVEENESDLSKAVGPMKKSSKKTSHCHSRSSTKTSATDTSRDVMVVHQPEFIDLSELRGIKKISKS